MVNSYYVIKRYLKYNDDVINFDHDIIDKTGLLVKNEIEVTEETLNVIIQLVRKPILIFSKLDERTLFTDESFKQTFSNFGLQSAIEIIKKIVFEDHVRSFENIFSYESHRVMFFFECNDILFQQQESILIFATKMDLEQNAKSTDEKIINLSKSILNINNTIDISDNVSKTLNLVLIEALKVFENGNFGSIFVVQDSNFKIMAHSGFSSDINNFKLPIRDSFLYVETHGKMDRIVLIKDIREKFTVFPTKTSTGEFTEITTSLVAPIYFRGSLYGMMSIDSEIPNAFSDDDFEIMTFIRDNVQAIITNQLSFLERTHQALTDPMTGLYNRLYLNEYLEMLIERSKRYNEKFCLVVFDIDNLKNINDQYGHLAGDHIIKTFATDLQKSVRRSDVLARFGGDEFVAVYLMTDEEEISRKLNALNKHSVYETNDQEFIELEYAFSFGISTFPHDGLNYSDLINIADSRMYQTKIENKEKAVNNV